MSTHKLIKTLGSIHHDLKVIAAYESTTLQDMTNELFEQFIQIKQRHHPSLKLHTKLNIDSSLYGQDLNKYRDEKIISKYEK